MAYFLNTKTNQVSEFDPAINKQLLNENIKPLPFVSTLQEAETVAKDPKRYGVITVDQLGNTTKPIPTPPPTTPSNVGTSGVASGDAKITSFQGMPITAD